jgi:activating signal cointegrator complex subunit 1
VITGNDKAGVRSARTRIDVLISTARKRLPFTHFLSFPVADESIRMKFDQFKDEVLQACAGVSSQLKCLVTLILPVPVCGV